MKEKTFFRSVKKVYYLNNKGKSGKKVEENHLTLLTKEIIIDSKVQRRKCDEISYC